MPALPPAVPTCTASTLTLATDAADGDFNGMSHAGTWLVVANTSGKACILPGLPTVSMKDAQGGVLPVARKAPVGMHPGPVVVPVRLEAGARAHASLRWVSGEVYDNSRCVEPARVELRFGKQVLEATLQGRLCGEVGQVLSIEQSPWTKVP